jgi:hypothetical protein
MRTLISTLLTAAIMAAATITAYGAEEEKPIRTKQDTSSPGRPISRAISEDVKTGGNPAKPGRALTQEAIGEDVNTGNIPTEFDAEPISEE